VSHDKHADRRALRQRRIM